MLLLRARWQAVAWFTRHARKAIKGQQASVVCELQNRTGRGTK